MPTNSKNVNEKLFGFYPWCIHIKQSVHAKLNRYSADGDTSTTGWHIRAHQGNMLRAHRGAWGLSVMVCDLWIALHYLWIALRQLWILNSGIHQSRRDPSIAQGSIDAGIHRSRCDRNKIEIMHASSRTIAQIK